MSDDPLPVTLDNIRKWDADMRGSDDRARHIALYYFATNLREVVGVLFAELAEARDKALEEAADTCEAHMKQFLDDNDVRKMWPATQARNDVYAGIIRALKSRKGTGDE